MKYKCIYNIDIKTYTYSDFDNTFIYGKEFCVKAHCVTA